MSMETVATNVKLVDIGDPPVSGRITSVTSLTRWDILRRVALPMVVGVFLALWAWKAFEHGSTYWGILLSVFAGLALLGGIAVSQSLAAPCPYCGEKIFNIARERNNQVIQCGKCYEYSTVNRGILRALDPAMCESNSPCFISPVYRSNIWPRACVVCGAPPTRFASISKTGASAVQFFVTVGSQFTRRGEVVGIPYCDRHQDGIRLKFRQSNKMLLEWCSLRIMRRYLAANRPA